MQLASALVLALLVTDFCRPQPLTFGNWVTNLLQKSGLVGLLETRYFVWLALPCLVAKSSRTCMVQM